METYLGENTPKLGFGLMRLPKKDNEIDIEQVKTMVDLFMEAGFTYFDTAFVYSGSEEAMKAALIDRYPRESFTVATKMAAWFGCKTREDAINQFETSLKRTGAGYFDYYLLHNLGVVRTKYFEDFDMWNYILEQKAQGKIKHIGFSFHSSAEELEEILIAHPEAEFVQLQINYADWLSTDIQSKRVYEVARKYNKPVVIMEPVKGGLLADPPEGVAKILKEADPNASFASWAIRFAASQEGVLTVLSGMSNIEQMQDNLSYMKNFKKLDATEQEVIARAQSEIAKYPLIPCTDCKYCAKVCPMNIGIPATFSAMNMLILYNDLNRAQGREKFHVVGMGKELAEKCIKCGQCEGVCPQHIEIRKHLEEAVTALHP
ncbi:MAG: aldo/keto reductase [Anaerolineaceae bacterium]|nr:aldo/keto reductase [Anaerolineaceae bacterium]